MKETLDLIKSTLLFLGDKMEIEFEAVHEGKKIFNVKRRGEKNLFTGTLDQCKRFIDVYKQKVLKQT
jgi:hypothetical protein